MQKFCHFVQAGSSLFWWALEIEHQEENERLVHYKALGSTWKVEIGFLISFFIVFIQSLQISQLKKMINPT